MIKTKTPIFQQIINKNYLEAILSRYFLFGDFSVLKKHGLEN